MATDPRTSRLSAADEDDVALEVVTLDPPRRGGLLRIGAIVLTAFLAAGVTLVGVRLLGLDGRRAPTVPSSTLDARGLGPSSRVVAGSTRLALLGPQALLDNRATGGLAAGASATATLPPLPPGSAAVLMEVSLVNANGPGAVVLTTSAGEVTALRLPAARAQLTSTVVVPVGSDPALTVRTEGGGHLFVNLLAAFEPAASSSAGRVVTVPASRVVALLPPRDGRDATFALADVPALREAGAVGALVLQVLADVGPNGGFVAAGSGGGPLAQTSYWPATSGTDRSRYALLVVPVTDGRVHLHYEAGNALTADVVGYVTGATAPDATAGLVMLARPAAAVPAQVFGGRPARVPVVPAGRIDGVAPDRVAAVLFTATTVNPATAAVTVRSPDGPAPASPTLAPGAGARSALILSAVVGGAVELTSDVNATVEVSPVAAVLTA